jgi:hypothetical protein
VVRWQSEIDALEDDIVLAGVVERCSRVFEFEGRWDVFDGEQG